MIGAQGEVDGARARLLSLADGFASRVARFDYLDGSLDGSLCAGSGMPRRALRPRRSHTPTHTLSITWPSSPHNNANDP